MRGESPQIKTHLSLGWVFLCFSFLFKFGYLFDMKNTFLLEELLLENRIDDVKKKYPNVPAEIIEEFASNDPSGTNKYLDWMVYTADRGIGMSNVIKNINLFHKNINKLTKEFFDEFVEEKKWGWLLTDDSPVARTFQSIYKSPKDINNYKDYGIASEIFKSVDTRLSKSEIKKLEAEVLYNSDDLLIMIPKSHKASCYYGAGTKWCTTSRDSDNYYQRYTAKGPLIYVINKKEPKSNIWHKAAFFIDQTQKGEAQAFDAPDTPTSIQKASENLSNWDVIRDVIVEYLYSKELKGIENFYFGHDLISWLESKNIDPLKDITPKELLNKVGKDTLGEYLKKRNINIFEYFNFPELLDLLSGGGGDIDGILKTIWDGYKSVGINPMTKMFLNEYSMNLVTDAIIKGTISLDDFLHLSSDPEFLDSWGSNEDIFKIITQVYGSKRADDWWGSKVDRALLKLFKNDVDLLFGYAKSIGVNLFDSIDVRGMNVLLNKKFDFENALKYILNNIDYLKGTLENYGFPTTKVLEYLGSTENGLNVLNELISKKLITDITLNDLNLFYKDPKKAFTSYIKMKYNDEDDLKYTIEDVLETTKSNIKNFVSNIEEFDSLVKETFKTNWDSYSLDPKILWFSFFERDYYQLYLNYYNRNSLYDLNPLILIKAYQDAPVGEETGLKEAVLSNAYDTLKGNINRGSVLFSEAKSDYVAFKDLSRLAGFFGGENDVYKILEGDLEGLDIDFTHYGSLEDIYYFLDNPEIKREVVEFLFNHFRNKKVTLGLDWIDEFDNWAEDIDDELDKFTVALYDERIEGMSDYQLQSLIEHSPELKQLRDIILKSYNKAYNNLGKTDVINHVLSTVEDVFGSDFMKQKEIVTKNKKTERVYTFRYDYLMDDIETYADDFVWYEDELPNSVYNLISYLMDQSSGRFDGYLTFDHTDLDNFFNNWSPNKETFIEEVSNILHKELSNVE